MFIIETDSQIRHTVSHAARLFPVPGLSRQMIVFDPGRPNDQFGHTFQNLGGFVGMPKGRPSDAFNTLQTLLFRAPNFAVLTSAHVVAAG